MVNTSWESISNWYKQQVGKKGLYYHQEVIFPKLIPILKNILSNKSSVIDIGCGQGIATTIIPKNCFYLGLDNSKSLIQSANEQHKSSFQKFLYQDVCKPFSLEKKDFDLALFILSLQNMAHPDQAIQQVAHHLKDSGRIIFVLNHPCFRIPRQSDWGYDENSKTQYRKVNCYLSPLKIPIALAPSQKKSPVTWSYHHSLSEIMNFLASANLLIEEMHEWCSNKVSTGGRKKAENRARGEFPLFLTLVAKKDQTSA